MEKTVNLIATLKTNRNLEDYEKAVNRGRTDDIYFYVNGNKVSVSYVHGQLSEQYQRKLLEHFLEGEDYEIN